MLMSSLASGPGESALSWCALVGPGMVLVLRGGGVDGVLWFCVVFSGRLVEVWCHGYGAMMVNYDGAMMVN